MLTTMQLTQFVMGIILSSSTYVYGKATQEQVGSLVFIQVSEQRKERSETSPDAPCEARQALMRLAKRDKPRMQHEGTCRVSVIAV